MLLAIAGKFMYSKACHPKSPFELGKAAGKNNQETLMGHLTTARPLSVSPVHWRNSFWVTFRAFREVGKWKEAGWWSGLWILFSSFPWAGRSLNWRSGMGDPGRLGWWAGSSIDPPWDLGTQLSTNQRKALFCCQCIHHSMLPHKTPYGKVLFLKKTPFCRHPEKWLLHAGIEKSCKIYKGESQDNSGCKRPLGVSSSTSLLLKAGPIRAGCSEFSWVELSLSPGIEISGPLWDLVPRFNYFQNFAWCNLCSLCFIFSCTSLVRDCLLYSPH